MLNIDPVWPLQKSLVDTLDSLFKKLKDLLLNLTKKLQSTYKSKRNIILLTTVIRAFQLVMDRGVQSKRILISESEALILFTALYKLVFLGTKFTQRVLQIQYSTTSQNELKQENSK